MIPREPEELKPDTAAKKEPEPAVPESLEQALAEAKKKVEEYLDGWKRTQADFINLKRRTEQEKLEMGRYANNQLILSLLPVLDDFERAFSNITSETAKLDWVMGIRLIENKLRATLEAQGLSAIEAMGKLFDPNLHEAVMQGKGEEGMVVQELRRGYKVFDKVIRYSQVVVGKGEMEETEEATQTENRT